MPKTVENRLTALGVKRLTKPGFHLDGRGLYLRIEGSRRLWVFRFTWQGKTSWYSIGPERDIGLAEAREEARKLRLIVREGRNPIEERRATKAAAQAEATRTFEHVARQYVASHEAGWRSEKHAADVLNSLSMYAFPTIGAKPIASITIADVLAVLEPIWRDKAETASRVRGRVESVIGYAMARHWRPGPNPAVWKGNLAHLLPARSQMAPVEHFPALPYLKLPALMARLAEADTISAYCARFAILTAARQKNAREAQWSEIDMDAATWSIPGPKMKAKRPHRVPLSPAALDILRAVQPLQRATDGWVFPGKMAGRYLWDVSVSKAFHAAGGEGFTLHGTARSSFKDWCREQTAYPDGVSEEALAHSNPDKTVAAYARSDLFEKRRSLMDAWAAYCTTPAKAGGGVVPIRGRA